MEYVQDPRFEAGRVWLLNFLMVEPGDQGRYYMEYGARARSHINKMEAGAGGGMQMISPEVWSLRGTAWSSVAIMQYPSRQAFLGYAMGSDRKGNKGMDDGFVLRTAGLAIQGLICLAPEADPEAVQDPEGPKVVP